LQVEFLPSANQDYTRFEFYCGVKAIFRTQPLKRITRSIKAKLEAQGALGQRLIKTAFGSMGMKISSKGLGFLNAVLLAKILGPAGYGIYAYVLALVSLLTIPIQMGIPILAVREIAATRALHDWNHMRGLIIRSHQAIAVLASLFVSIALVLLYFFGREIEPRKLHTMLLGLVLVPIISMAALRGGMLRGLRQIIPGQMPEQIVRPGILLLLLFALYFLPADLHTPATAFQIQIVACSVAICVAIYFFHLLKPTELAQAQSQYKNIQWLKSSIPLGLSAALLVLNNQIDTFLLGTFKTNEDVGVYRIAAQMATLVILSLQVVNSILAPHIAHIYAKGDMARLQKLISKSAFVVVAITLPVVLAIIIFGETIINLAFGHEFAGAYIPLVILCVGQLVNASMCSVVILLNMTGHERETAKIMAFSAALSIILHLSFIPLWGTTGAALATAITMATWNIILCRKVYTHTRIKAFAFS
jgi:O-antigen/teichoic acid export membrane protein